MKFPNPEALHPITNTPKVNVRKRRDDKSSPVSAVHKIIKNPI